MACTSDRRGRGRQHRALAVAVFALLLALGAGLLAPRGAHAQRRGSRDAQVRALVRAAVNDYQSVEIDAALSRLELALRACRDPGSCSPTARASVHATIGVIQLNGRNDASAAQQAFVLALQADPQVELDRVIATPEANAALVRARRALGVGGTEQLLHTPVEEQLANTPVPLYVQGSGASAPARVEVAYRAPGADAWTTMPMARSGQGFAVEVPCSAVRPPALEYYITGLNEQGRVVGEAGSEAVPLRAEVVIRRTRAAPFIPGRLPPETCGGRSGQQLGAPCARASECAAGLACVSGACAAQPGAAGGPEPERSWFAANLGGGIGFGFLDSLGANAAYAEALPDPDNPMGPAFCDPMTLSCPVPVSGVGFTPHIVLNARVHFHRRVGAGLGVRWQPDAAGRTTLAPVLLQLRGYVAVTPAGFARRGLIVAPFLGTGVGQIQPRAPAPSAERMGLPTGHLITGLNNVHFGAVVEYAFLPVLHAGAEVALHVMFPRVMANLDLQLYLGVHY